MKQSKKNIQCANCGCYGHIFKRCFHPITSFGIICYRLSLNKLTNTIFPEYLMIQRKDSLCYVQFLRGKYKIGDRLYILSMFEKMTLKERKDINDNAFDYLWKKLWQIKSCSNYFKEYSDAKHKFETLKQGLYLLSNGNTTFFLHLV